MEKPSTKKPMNILKTMVFLKNFMYLVIKTHSLLETNPEFIHFIELTKQNVESETKKTINLIHERFEVIDKVYLSKTRLTNW